MKAPVTSQWFAQVQKSQLAAMRSTIMVLLLLLAGCFPFGTEQRTISGDYRLERSEDGETFYLAEKGRPHSGGGVLEGTVEQIGWNDRFVAVKRQSLVRGDPNSRDGWMIIDLKTKIITGPFSDTESGTIPNFQECKPSLQMRLGINSEFQFILSIRQSSCDSFRRKF